MALTEVTLRNLKPQSKTYTVNDFDGLSVCVDPNGSKLWHFRFSWQGKQPRISLGKYPEVGLKQARVKRDEYRSLIANGIDPRLQKRRVEQAGGEKKLTFEMFVPKWVELKFKKLGEDAPDSRNTTRTQIQRYLKKDILPVLGIIPINEIKRSDVLQVLQRIESRGALSIAEKIRTWLNEIFRHAMVEGLIDSNPASDMDIVALPKPPVSNNPHLEMAELPALLAALAKYPGDIQTKLALKLLLLTGVRPGELRFSRPEHFDLENAIWSIPAEKVKQLKRKVRNEGKDIPPYIVPLSTQALKVVQELLSMCYKNQPYLLRGRIKPNKPVCENTLNLGFRRLGYEGRLTSHGVRGTLSTALNELDYDEKWIESQLSHQDPNKSRRAYNHAKYIRQRRKMMQDWADRLDAWEAEGLARSGCIER